MTPQERVLDAVLRAHGILAEYVEQSPRKCESTLDRLFAVLDDQDLIAAVNRMNLESVATREAKLPLMREPSERAG
jgi:hypothetical protein